MTLIDGTFVLMTRTHKNTTQTPPQKHRHKNAKTPPQKHHNKNTPVLLHTTEYYFKTSPYYKVLLQYYSVLQSATKSTSYYKVLLQYYSVLQSTTPVFPYYKVLRQYYKVLLQPAFSVESGKLESLLVTGRSPQRHTTW